MTTHVALGLDLAAQTGYAVLEQGRDRPIAYGVIDMTALAAHGALLGTWQTRLRELVREHRPTVVAYEALTWLRGRAWQRRWYGMEAVLLSELYGQRLSVVAVPPAELKTYATGAGRAPKQAVIDAAVERWRIEPPSHDEADALWLAAIGMDEMRGGPADRRAE